MLEGSCTVVGGNPLLGDLTLRAGQQSVITPGPPGQVAMVTIQPIPGSVISSLEADCTMASSAKKTVYFEVQTAGPAPITVFYANTASAPNTGTTTAGVSAGPAPSQTIIAIPVVPANLPVQYTVSPANL
jgi:hypothetical protein